MTPLALAIFVRLGKDVWMKSLASNVMWLVAPESSSHAPYSASHGELKQT
jgi:hypothetical protein